MKENKTNIKTTSKTTTAPQNTLQTFINQEFGTIRTVQLNNETYFVGVDVANALEYHNGSRDINRHVDEEDRTKMKIFDGKQNKETIVINESGLYSLIFGSTLDSARRFKHWITSEVLPTIRKTGGYVHNADTFLNTYLPNADEPTKLMFKAQLTVIRNLNDRIEHDKPLVAFATYS